MTEVRTNRAFVVFAAALATLPCPDFSPSHNITSLRRFTQHVIDYRLSLEANQYSSLPPLHYSYKDNYFSLIMPKLSPKKLKTSLTNHSMMYYSYYSLLLNILSRQI